MLKKMILAALLTGSMMSAGAWGQKMMIVGLQVINLSGDHYVLRVQSTGPQAFDVLPTAPDSPISVRLHGAELGNIPPLGNTPFGMVRMEQEPGTGGVILRISLLPGYSLHASQTGKNTVDFTIQR